MDLSFIGEVKKRTPTKEWSEGEIDQKLREFDEKIEDCKKN